MKRIHYSTAAVFLALLTSPSLVSADEQARPAKAATNTSLTNLPQQEVLIGPGQAPTADLVTLTTTDPSDQQPSVTLLDISGQPNPNQTGTAYFDDITIDLVGHNVTDDHFLTEEGLYWSDRTQSQLIKGSEQGQLNDASTFGVQNTPTSPVTAYSINVGDSGRLTHVGKTKSGIELDLIWTVLSSDRDDWLTHSGYNDGRIKGLGFAGEQSIPGASGNAIVVLYNEASHLNLHYQLVKHGTTEEQPVILSFISTDIDAAQGVKTNLANLAEVIPQDANLIKTDGIIYDSTPGVVGLNGSVDLPNGGYLGAGFLSHFDYHFFSPAPERAQDSYAYPIAVRYDIFGSSLQAKLSTRLTQQIQVSYQDKAGKAIKPDEHYQGFKDQTYQVSSVALPKHRLIEVKKDTSNQNLTKISFIYERDYTLTLDFVDDNGQSLKASSQVTGPAGQPFRMEAPTIDGYRSDTIHQSTITGDQTLRFVYKKVTSVQPSNPSQPTGPTQPNNPSQPTNPAQPSSPSQPTNPSQPSNPSQPTNPAQPSNPSQPINPTQPSNSNPSTNPVQPSTPAQPTGQNQPPSRPQLTSGGTTISDLVQATARPSTQPTQASQTITAAPPISTQPHWIMPPAVQAIPWQASVVAPAVRANARPVALPKYKPGNALSEAMEHGLVPFPKSNPALMEKETWEAIYGKNLQKAKADYHFEVNTGLNKAEQEIFFGYLKEVKKLAEKKHGKNNIHKINHAIANAIAGVEYANDLKQYSVNDFNPKEYSKLKYYKEFHRLVRDTARNPLGDPNKKFYFIDFPHLAMPLASSYSSSWYKEVIKGAMSHMNRGSLRTSSSNPVDTFFWLNSYTGDRLTTFGYRNKDLPTDQDAWIIHKLYHTGKTTLDQQLKAYYSQPLDRQRDLDKIEKKENKGRAIKVDYDGAASATIGAAVIVTLTAAAAAYSKTKEKVFDPLVAFGKKTIIEPLEKFGKNMAAFFSPKPSAIKAKPKIALQNETVTFPSGGNKVIGKTIRPTAKPKNQVVQPKPATSTTDPLRFPSGGNQVLGKAKVSPSKSVTTPTHSKSQTTPQRPILRKPPVPLLHKVVSPIIQTVKHFIAPKPKPTPQPKPKGRKKR